MLSYKHCAPSEKWKPFGALLAGLRLISLNLLSSPPGLPPRHTELLASWPWVFVRGCLSPCLCPDCQLSFCQDTAGAYDRMSGTAPERSRAESRSQRAPLSMT